MKEFFTNAFYLYILVSTVVATVSYWLKRQGAIGLGHGSVSPKYTKWVWHNIYGAKTPSIPDACDRTYDLLKIVFRAALVVVFVTIGPLLLFVMVMDFLNLVGVRLPRRVPEGGFEADRDYKPLGIDLGESDQGHLC